MRGNDFLPFFLSLTTIKAMMKVSGTKRTVAERSNLKVDQPTLYCGPLTVLTPC